VKCPRPKEMKLQYNSKIRYIPIQDQSIVAKEHLHSQHSALLMKEGCEVLISTIVEVRPMNMN
jgi:hypothetical protein